MVSVIVPVYNRPVQLVDAVTSAATQDYRPVEVLIIDDGSTDGRTPAAAAALADRFPGIVSVHRISNGGPGLAREAGRVRASGEFIQYLDSDDVILPGKLTAQVAALNANPQANVAYGITRYRRADGVLDPGAHKGTGANRGHMFPDFLTGRWWDTSTPLYRRSLCDWVGPWTDLRLEEDWEYDCRVASIGGTLAYCDVEVSETRDHGDDRLSRQMSAEAARVALSMRARAHDLVWQHAKRAQLPVRHAEAVARFMRSLFLLARQCGAHGLDQESARLLDLADEAARTVGAVRHQLSAYRWVSRFVGLRGAGLLAARLDRFRASLPGHAAR